MTSLLLFILFTYLLYRIIKIAYRNFSNIRDKIGAPLAAIICIALFLITFTLFDQLDSILSIFFGFASIGFIAILIPLIAGGAKTSSPKRKQKKQDKDRKVDETYTEFLKDMRSRKERYYKC